MKFKGRSKKTLCWRATVAAIAVALQPLSIAFAGGISEGGGDLHSSWFGAAWYLGTKPIQTCIEISPDFGITSNQARSEIQSAFQTWDRYMTAKRVNRGLDADPTFRIASSVELLPSCDGNEELTFYLGGSHPRSEAVKKQFENPMAFVHRERYDLDQARSKGFVWITRSGGVLPGAGMNGSPDWSMPYNFHGIVLHEVGHLMGVPHVDGTIMDEDWLLPRFQSQDENFRKASFTRIDYLKEVKLQPISEVRFEGFFGHWACDGKLSSCVSKYQDAYKALTGKEKAPSFISARFIGDYQGQMRLELQDETGDTPFLIEKSGLEDPTTFVLQEGVFKTYRGFHDRGGLTGSGSSYSQVGSVEYGTIITPIGERFLAVIERNSSDPTPLQIQVILPKIGLTPIFHADKFKMPY